MRIIRCIAAILIALWWSLPAFAQPKAQQLKKPKQYEERKLGSEKMAEKKFTLPRHLFQNMYTHYNYYFNANNKLNEIIATAKTQHQEDYSQLLPFYNYSYDNTAANSEIDSILEKCTAGILLHDLRNDWIDNLYLIMGRAYMLRKDFDSAAMTFQYINYAYSPKEEDGYDKVIGSNRNEGGNAFTISTKEKSNVVKKVFTKPPSRNESFVWQIRNFTEKGEYIDAGSLITTLRNDPNFPARLKEELAEAEAYNYYRQQIYDSSAHYLAQAVELAQNRTEKARWYYLIGQMYQLSGQNGPAAEYFAKCVKVSVDPVMEVYARLSTIRLRKADAPALVQQNLDEILKMARREKYEPYRDIIYYAAALVELERAGYIAAENFLHKSILYNSDNTLQRSKSFLLLSNMLYDTKAYGRSGFYYDSVNTAAMDSGIIKTVAFRKPPTKSIYEQDRIIFAQDSLQKIATMPEADRNAYVRALSKRLRKAKGLKEEVDFLTNTGGAVNPNDIGKGPANLFDDNAKDFYFYNPQQRSAGFNQFKQRWGGRPNVDNWRRTAAVQANFARQTAAANNQLSATSVQQDPAASPKSGPATIDEIYNPTEVTFDALTSNLPLTPDNISASNKSINEAMLAKGKALQNSIEDLPEAIKVYEALLARLSENDMAEEVIFNLIYCYEKTGDLAKAAALRKRLNGEFGNGQFAARVNNPALGTEKANPAATEAYKKIYNQFIEGSFDEAVNGKKIADSVYGSTYWNPQLLYIEAVYYVKERQDTAAIQRLNVLAATYPTSPLAEKARLMADILGRRKQIEDYLTKLNITRATDDSTISIPTYTAPVVNVPVAVAPTPKLNQDSLLALQQAAANKAIQDSIRNAAIAKRAADDAALAAANKARNDSLKAALATAKKLRDDSVHKATAARLAAAKSAKDSLLIVQAAARQARLNSIRDAKTAKLAAAKAARDSINAALALKTQQRKDSITAALALKRAEDSLKAVQARAPKPIEGFLVKPAEPQSVLILLHRVDPIYLNEGMNAFNRYSIQRMGQAPAMQKAKLNNEYSIITMSSPSFTNAATTIDFVNRLRPKAATEIVPWLEASKMSFYIISAENLEVLKQTGNVSGYLKALKQAVPNTF